VKCVGQQSWTSSPVIFPVSTSPSIKRSWPNS
jgi:hypothetical protein